MTSSARRVRRSTAEVRRLVLAAARERFAAEGYGGATTIAIAARADVSETVLFRHFPTKERLFEAAVLEPFEVFLERYVEGWASLPLTDGAPEPVLRTYASELYDIVHAERELFAALMARGLPSRALLDALAKLETVGEGLAAAHGFTYDTKVAVRAAFLMVVSMAVFEGQLFEAADGVDRDRIVATLGDIMVSHTMYGAR